MSSIMNLFDRYMNAVGSSNRQGLNKAGIMITKELAEAVERCRQKVQTIAKDCKENNRRFRDPEFDFLDDKSNCLHGLPSCGPEYNPTDALRVNQIFEKPEFLIKGATASDIRQGKIGDCWFLSGLALIATADLVEKICVARDERVGVYGFIFWRDAGWVDVIIDDLLFVQIPKWRDIDEKASQIFFMKHQWTIDNDYKTRVTFWDDQDAHIKQARKGNKILYFSKSATENETWVPLLEKAYAKLHGDYAALDGGRTNEAVEDLSGAVSSWMYVRDILDTEKFWKEELLKANKGLLFACSIIDECAVNGDGQPSSDPLNGLLTNHAYSVVKAMEHNGIKFVKIRNPWGDYEWKGRWSDGSEEWTKEWLKELDVLDYKFADDGEFLMEYSDFLNTWDSVERCRLFDENWSLSQRWLQVSLGNHPQLTNLGDVSFTINLSKPTPVFLMLSQLDTRYFIGVGDQYKSTLRFKIFKHGEKKPLASSFHDALWRRSVNLELKLEAGDYVVHVMIDRTPPHVPSSSSPEPAPRCLLHCPSASSTPPPHPSICPSHCPSASSTPPPHPSICPSHCPSASSTPPPHPSICSLHCPSAPSTPPPDTRKKVQKKTELLIGASIASNFRSSDYVDQMPLPEDIFHGKNLTSMEEEMKKAMHGSQPRSNFKEKAGFESKDKSEDSDIMKDGEREGLSSVEREDKKTEDKPVSSSTSKSSSQKDEPNESRTEEFEGAKPGLSPSTRIAERGANESLASQTLEMPMAPLKVETGQYEDNTQIEMQSPSKEGKDNSSKAQDNPQTESKPSNDVVTLGLKVYALKDCQVNIKEQLRDGNIIRKYVATPRDI